MSTEFKLYKIGEQLDQLLSRIDDPDSPITEAELVELVGKLEKTQTEKFLELRNAIINEDAKLKAIEVEIDRLSTMKDQQKRAVESMKAASLTLMQLAGLTKVEFPTGGFIRVQANSAPSVEVSVPVETLPAEYFTTKTVVQHSLNRAEVLQAFDMGAPLPPEIKVTRGSHVRLK